MSDYTISIPEPLYEKVQQVAKQTSRQVDDVIRLWLEDAVDNPPFEIPVDERDELKAMAYLSDDTLWMMARQKLQKPVQDRMSVLMTKNTHGTITPSEYAELERLVERGDELTLRKAQAINYLTKRGYVVTLDDLKSAADE